MRSTCGKPCICVGDILKCEWLDLEEIPFIPPTQVGKIAIARMIWPRIEDFPNLKEVDLRNNSGLNCSAVNVLQMTNPKLTIKSSCSLSIVTPTRKYVTVPTSLYTLLTKLGSSTTHPKSGPEYLQVQSPPQLTDQQIL